MQVLLALTPRQSFTLLASSQFHQRLYPYYNIKYMGLASKSKIMDFVLFGINEVYKGRPLYDLFGGTASLTRTVGDQAAIHSNGIQRCSAVLARAYLASWRTKSSPTFASIISRQRL